MSHAGTSQAKVPAVPALRIIKDGAIQRTIAVVASQWPSPQIRLPGIARAWHTRRTAPAYRIGPRVLSGANRNPPNSPIQPIPNHRSPKERTSKLDTRNTAKPRPANRRRSRWEAAITTATHTSPIGRVIPTPRTNRPAVITLRLT